MPLFIRPPVGWHFAMSGLVRTLYCLRYPREYLFLHDYLLVSRMERYLRWCSWLVGQAELGIFAVVSKKPTADIGTVVLAMAEKDHCKAAAVDFNSVKVLLVHQLEQERGMKAARPPIIVSISQPMREEREQERQPETFQSISPSVRARDHL